MDAAPVVKPRRGRPPKEDRQAPAGAPPDDDVLALLNAKLDTLNAQRNDIDVQRARVTKAINALVGT